MLGISRLCCSLNSHAGKDVALGVGAASSRAMPMLEQDALIREGIDALITAHNKQLKSQGLPTKKKGWLLREVYFKGLHGWASKSDERACQTFNNKGNPSSSNQFSPEERRRAGKLLE